MLMKTFQLICSLFGLPVTIAQINGLSLTNSSTTDSLGVAGMNAQKVITQSISFNMRHATATLV